MALVKLLEVEGRLLGADSAKSIHTTSVRCRVADAVVVGRDAAAMVVGVSEQVAVDLKQSPQRERLAQVGPQEVIEGIPVTRDLLLWPAAWRAPVGEPV